MRSTLLGILVNLGLSATKISAGAVGHSFALVADGLESGADVLSGLVVFFGLKIAIKPPDRDHPYGHGKAEPTRLEATAPWGLKSDADIEEGTARNKHSAESAPSPFHFAHFGMLSRGNCWLSVEGIPEPIPFAGGDCFLLAPGSAYSLRDNPRTRARSLCEVAPRNGSQVIEYGGGGAPTTIISGWFRFGATSVKPLTRLLPPLILIKADQAQSLALHTTLNMLASETAVSAPGSELVVNRLADMLFIHSIRAHIGSQSEACKSGLLRAIFDPQIGVALKSMHEKVEHPWTVESLAAACGMSRSAFAVRFKDLVGETPLEYLTSWRMQKATALLHKGEKKLFEVAKSVGYDSDAAFSKAFKRMVGVAPRQYRRSATMPS